MRKAISVSALLLALTCSAYAGEMQNGVTGTPPPTPPPNGITQEEQLAEGVMPNGEPDGLTEAVLTVIESVLALF